MKTEQTELLELANDNMKKNKFIETTLESFWLAMINEYPRISTKALKIVMPFSSSYLRESAFSSLLGIKTKKRNRICDVEDLLRLKLTKIQPNIGKIIKLDHKQNHPSHSTSSE